MLLLAARFVKMLLAGLMHQIELIHEAAFFKQFQSSIHRDAVEFGIFFLGELKQAFGVEVLPGLIDQIEQDSALAREPHTAGRQSWGGIGHAQSQFNVIQP
jgi:hypothetical protein